MELEPLKTELADLKERIKGLETLVDGQTDASAAYQTLYRKMEMLKSDTDCFIPTVRCQLDLLDKVKKCICEAIAATDDRVDKAKKAAQEARIQVDRLERQHTSAAKNLEWATRWYNFLKTDVKARATALQEDLKALRGLADLTADPKKDHCEVWFYLYEMERLLKSSYGTGEACWQADQTVGTYLDCWSLDCYERGWNRAIVDFNEAEAAEKVAASMLAQAKARTTDLETAATEAVTKRREWILKEIKARSCCGPLSKCP